MRAHEPSLQELSARLEERSKSLPKRKASPSKQLSDALSQQLSMAASLSQLELEKGIVHEQLGNSRLQDVFPKKHSVRENTLVFDGAWVADKALFAFLSWANSTHRRLQSIEWLSDGSFKFHYRTMYAGINLQRTAILSDSHKNVNLGGVVGFASGASVRFSLKNLFEKNGLEQGSVLGARSIPHFSTAAMRKRLMQRYATPLGKALG